MNLYAPDLFVFTYLSLFVNSIYLYLNIARKLATSDQFAAEMRKKFQTAASDVERKLRSVCRFLFVYFSNLFL